MNTDQNAAASADDPGDNLEQIKGIGLASVRALNKIDIYRPADLLKYQSPEELHEALTKAGEKILLGKIRNDEWLGQAKAIVLAQQEHPTPTSTLKDTESAPEPAQPSSKEEWEQHAGFNLYFQFKTDEQGRQEWRTLIYKSLEPDHFNDRKEFPGTEQALWADWILAQARLPAPVEPIAPRAEVAALNEAALERGGMMDEIKLKRGDREVTFSKVSDTFAVRLKHGRAASEAALETSLGRSKVAVRHVDSIRPEKMEVFRVEEAAGIEDTVDELRQSPNADIVSHVYTLDSIPGGEVIPTGTLTIQFKPELAQTKQEEILAEFGLEVVEDLDFLPGGYTVRLTKGSPENPLKIAVKLQQRPEIEAVEPDLSFQVSLKYAPADPLYQEQWHLKNRGDRLGLKAGADVKAEEAWDITRGKRSITICVIDDGCDLGHPDFDAPDKIVAPRDFGQADFDPSPVFTADRHGTACAGVALAEENGTGVVGLAPECAFMPVRFSDSLSDNTVVDYFKYAMEQGADVISCSWSATSWDFPLSIKMKAIIHQAATQGRFNKKGCVILFAAGNESRPLDGVKDGQISHQGFALHPDVIAVAASNSLDKRASYSNFGPEIALCAPSNGSPGRGIVTTDRRGIDGYASGDYTFSFGGTSSATPLAAGLAALILSIKNDLTSAEVKQIMMETADKIDQANGQYVNGHSPWYGHGRINAYQALKRTLELSTGVDQPAETKPPQGETILDILEVKLSQVGSVPDVLEHGLVAEIRFKISGSEATALTSDQAPYRIDVTTLNRESAAPPNLVASKQSQLQPQKFEYVEQLKFPIPYPGRYELQSRIALMLSSCNMSDSYQGYFFRVNL